MLKLIAFAALLVQLQGVGGQVVFLNPDQVVNLRKPRGIEQGHFPQGTQCLAFTSDSKYVALAQSCESARKALEGAGRAGLIVDPDAR